MKKRRKRKSLIIVPVASMGDIAFLLIIFFMVASQLARDRVAIEQPRSLDAFKMKDKQVSVTLDAGGNIYVQGTLCRDPDAVEYRLRTLLEDRTSEEDRIVLFRCDKSVTEDRFGPVIESIVKAGGLIGAVGEKGEPVGAGK
jgi:biopolymer transport protein ExbD